MAATVVDVNDGSKHIAVFRVELENVEDFFVYIAKTRAAVLITSVRLPTARLDMPNTRADICPVLGEIYLYLPIYIIDICSISANTKSKTPNTIADLHNTRADIHLQL